MSNEITNRSENDYNELLSPDNDDNKSIASNSNLSNHDLKEEKKTNNEQDDIDFWLSTSKAPTTEVTDEKKTEKKKSKKSKSSEKEKENGTHDSEKSSKHKEKKKEKESKKDKPLNKSIEEEGTSILSKSNHNGADKIDSHFGLPYKKLASNKHLKLVS